MLQEPNYQVSRVSTKRKLEIEMLTLLRRRQRILNGGFLMIFHTFMIPRWRERGANFIKRYGITAGNTSQKSERKSHDLFRNDPMAGIS
eukprot:snap_masked-scaffold_5-processed-gene-16.29-mRNA-1 protein AED:0.78 eAED:1.00 QI:0/0/0/0.25/1/1/4/0/88